MKNLETPANFDCGRTEPLTAMMPGFECFDVQTSGACIRGVRAGKGTPVLLLHGHPQNHLTWYKLAPRLVDAGFAVIATDLRGYGDSSKPGGGENHENYSKRAMALDQIETMQALGFSRFTVIGHDRGGRVAHRMALDFPEAVSRLAVLDIAPTLTMYERTDKEFATRYFWWFFLIQPFDLPERMIGADPEYFLRRHIAGQNKTAGAMNETIIADYLRCYRDPATIHAICEDYRAAASIDLEHDITDRERKIRVPLLALWGAKTTVGALYDVLDTWREKAIDVRGRAIECGHLLQEENPEAVLSELLPFLEESNPPTTVRLT